MEGEGFQSGTAPSLANSRSSCPAGSLTVHFFPNRNPSITDHPLQFNSKNTLYLVPCGAIPLKYSGPVYLPFRDTNVFPLERRLHHSQNKATLTSSSYCLQLNLAKPFRDPWLGSERWHSRTNSPGLQGLCVLHQQSMLAWKHQLFNSFQPYAGDCKDDLKTQGLFFPFLARVTCSSFFRIHPS